MIRILHFSTHNENCGIGKYQEMFLEQMKDSQEVYNEFFELSPNKIKTMQKKEYKLAFSNLRVKLKDFDILHIQHEYSFFWQDELERALDISRELHKKSIVTVHTSANIGHKKAALGGLGPRSWAAYARAIRREKTMYNRFIKPLKMADLILVHNEVTRKSLMDREIDEDKIQKIVIPVPTVDFKGKSTVIKDALNIREGDIVISTIGFLHRYKGIKQAIKSLKYLPENYKLAIIGGLHPGTDDTKIYDDIADLIIHLNLKHRVYITGYVPDDNKMNSLIRECDICVYPYDNEYYSNVSSAALNNAFANHMPVIAYPTESFKEVDNAIAPIQLTTAFSYYELYRELIKVDMKSAAKNSEKYAKMYSYPILSHKLFDIYKLLNGL